MVYIPRKQKVSPDRSNNDGVPENRNTGRGLFHTAGVGYNTTYLHRFYRELSRVYLISALLFSIRKEKNAMTGHREQTKVLRLVKPTPDMEDAYLSFVSEWEEAGEDITPYAVRPFGRTYSQWLADTIAAETVAPEGYVTMSSYFLIDDGGEIIGAANIRHRLNAHILRHSGHIGYGVRPSRRRQGYATAMLTMALPIARGLGIDRVLVTCDKQNIGSAKTIIKNGGVLENEMEEEGNRILQRYWIDL